MIRLSRAEATLFLIPILFVPIAILGQKWKAANTPKPTSIPTATPAPSPNLYANHYAQVEAILPAPDGKVIHTGEQSSKTKFHTWDARSGNLIRSFGVFRLGNADAVLSPNGKILGFGYGGWNGDRIVLFDSTTGKEKLQIQKPKATGYGFSLNDDVIAVPANDDMRFFSVRNGKFIRKLRHRARDFYPTKPRFSPDGKKILWIGYTNNDFDSYANGNSNDEIVWFDWKKGKRINAIEFPQTDLFQARFSGDGKIILASGFRRYWVKSRATKSAVATDVRFFAIDAQTGKQIYTWLINDWPNDIAVSPNGKWFTFPIQESRDAQAKQYLGVFNVRTGKEKFRIEGWFSNTGAWSPDSKTLYVENGLMWRLRLQDDGRWKLNKGKSAMN